jgi:transposase
MRTKRRYELTDAQWARLEPLLPPEKPRTGRPNDDHRRILNGILWVLNSGAPWLDLPRRYGPVGTVSSRFYRWRRSGVWQRVLEALQAVADAGGRVGWELHFLDSTVVRAHQHAAGARKAGREPGAAGDEALGRSRGGFTTKIHVRSEGYGKPVTFTLTGGQVHDSQQVTALIDRGAIRRIGRGRPRLRPAKVVGDKAYSSRSIRQALRKRGISPVIPTKANERRQPDFDREAYRQRNIVERLINRLKNFRRIATRYEKRAVNYLAMIHIAAILLWI